MKAVYEHIGARTEAFARQPLFALVRDESVDPARRLRFIPNMAHFVMSFADLYNHVLPEDARGDRNLELVNAHLEEDAGHWKWFLADLANANLDPELRFSDALRFLYGNETVATRLLSYRICQLSGGLRSSLEKLVLVNCIEATGKTALTALAAAGNALEKTVGKRLVYFGGHHVETEEHHTLEETSVRRSLEDQQLGDAERRSALALVDKTFVLFENAVAEMYRVAQRGGGFDRQTQRDAQGSEEARGAGEVAAKVVQPAS